MAQTAKRLIEGAQMTGVATAYFVATATTVIKKLILCNTTAGAVACTVYLIPSAGTPGAPNAVTWQRSVASGDTEICWEASDMVLEVGGEVMALGAGVTIMASGIELT